jgi:hypothetical protein
MHVPDEIAAEVVAHQKRMHFPEHIPKYISFFKGGKELWTGLLNADLATCEQAVEYHIRKGESAIKRWHKTHKAATARCAAYHIFTARVVKCRCVGLMGMGDIPESHMPFSQEPEHEEA